MGFRLIDSNWNKVIRDAAKADRSELRIVCPFIKLEAVTKLLKAAKPKSVEVITRFKLGDFYEGVSDTAALRLLLERGAKIRGVKNLHAKLYLFGDSSALVTSANMTLSAMQTNHELGFLADDPQVMNECRNYFDRLWKLSGSDLTDSRLTGWERKLAKAWASGARSSRPKGLRDEGADAGLTDDGLVLPGRVADAPQSFVKLFGSRERRLLRSDDIFAEVQLAGSHWACAYPKNKRPTSVVDGALMFMARLVEGPGDIIIYGRAIGMAYEPGRDDATKEDLKERPWKETWPRYIRVHSPEFLTGTLENGVPLSALMDELGAHAFAATKRNLDRESGNTNPRHAYRQQAAIKLTPEGSEWLNRKLEQAFKRYGQLSQSQVESLDWPEVPASA